MTKKQADECYCKSCGDIIKKEAELCVFCGVRQRGSDYCYHGKSKTCAVLLAVFLAPFNWLYTYKKDATKFWWGLILGLALIWTFVVPLGIWIWAIVDALTKSEEWYKSY